MLVDEIQDKLYYFSISFLSASAGLRLLNRASKANCKTFQCKNFRVPNSSVEKRIRH